ncbi:MAG TPA: hypothetical protein VLH86_03810 [Patescibacteria group bacterium]|nr:hypothetical protein [Patescibacteria group bacterium]
MTTTELPQASQPQRDRRPLDLQQIGALSRVVQGMTANPPESVLDLDKEAGWRQRIGLVTNIDGDPNRWIRTRRYEPMNEKARRAGHVACITIWHHAPSPCIPRRHPSEQDTGVSVSVVEDGVRREAAVDIRWGEPPVYTESLVGEAEAYVGTPNEAFGLISEAFARHLGITLIDVATDVPI